MEGSLYCTAMKYVAMTLLILASLVSAVSADETGPDTAKLLNDLTAANAAKDVTQISALLPAITDAARRAKDVKLLDPLAKELVTSYKLAKGNWGTMRKTLDALGELRSKKGLSLLKKVAFQKKAKNDDYLKLQIHAIAAIGKFGESKLIDPLIDQTKNRENKIAIAAYETFRHYGIAKGRTRKKVAEELMKRLEAENPYSTSSNSNAGPVGEEKKKRWTQIQKPVVTSLQAVCHEDTINDLDNWREWWKENKKSRTVWKNNK